MDDLKHLARTALDALDRLKGTTEGEFERFTDGSVSGAATYHKGMNWIDVDKARHIANKILDGRM